MNEQYQIGDVANGHILTEFGWEPTEQTITARQIEAEVDRRMANSKAIAWVLWFFLGGFNGHLAYIYPKQRWVIVVVSVALFLVTFGLSGLLWLGTWAFLLNGKFPALREHTRREVESELLTRKALYA